MRVDIYSRFSEPLRRLSMTIRPTSLSRRCCSGVRESGGDINFINLGGWCRPDGDLRHPQFIKCDVSTPAQAWRQAWARSAGHTGAKAFHLLLNWTVMIHQLRRLRAVSDIERHAQYAIDTGVASSS
jgi:hypothetical protein